MTNFMGKKGKNVKNAEPKAPGRWQAKTSMFKNEVSIRLVKKGVKKVGKNRVLGENNRKKRNCKEGQIISESNL